MSRFAPFNNQAVVFVQYDCRKERKEKKFTDVYAARRFYAQKFKQGKNPKLKATRT